ncbi:OmpH family outer membrane protein [Legionella israelensis]|uniref:OmpH family outer membrane protein n=1 Tax=Legionella israelensis TaxID=454 RepID=A0A0W0V700_9GAMM|nr:OmpH family outer membrane protein [Legionella israelensis]KTD15905.1 outer membrane protein OmpH [Legionella israelensis]QBR83318.1 OmpH family outer membrane protein [Legionella israelensis]QBS09306.1 OmpH family outer membrane protein [Legionella israelensis]SCY22084.1 outer membrane protein [Legionella israelensis DSM 19235]STX60200.1 outer membrane protein OmpH [Legionella israelensis]
MKRLSLLFIALVLSFSGTSVFANWSKIGVVDLQKIIQTSPQMKNIQEKLEKEFKPRRDKLVSMETELKNDMEKFKRDASVMSEAQKKELQTKIIDAQKKFEREGQQYQQELSTAHNKAMEGLYNKVRDAIAKVAKDQKYDLILQKDAAPYSVQQLDVTDKVVEEIS